MNMVKSLSLALILSSGIAHAQSEICDLECKKIEKINEAASIFGEVIAKRNFVGQIGYNALEFWMPTGPNSYSWWKTHFDKNPNLKIDEATLQCNDLSCNGSIVNTATGEVIEPSFHTQLIQQENDELDVEAVFALNFNYFSTHNTSNLDLSAYGKDMGRTIDKNDLIGSRMVLNQNIVQYFAQDKESGPMNRIRFKPRGWRHGSSYKTVPSSPESLQYYITDFMIQKSKEVCGIDISTNLKSVLFHFQRFDYWYKDYPAAISQDLIDMFERDEKTEAEEFRTSCMKSFYTIDQGATCEVTMDPAKAKPDTVAGSWIEVAPKTEFVVKQVEAAETFSRVTFEENNSGITGYICSTQFPAGSERVPLTLLFDLK